MKKDRIFVQIASYRDPQLVPTLRDMFSNADHPEYLEVGICWQRDETESLEEFSEHLNVKFLDYHYSESMGLGWARSELRKLYDGQKFTLQLDSHHRFAQGWDTMMFEDYYQGCIYSEKPIISTYLTPFEVEKADECRCNLNPTPCLMSQYEFSTDKLLMSRPHYIQDYRDRRAVIKARTISGHFMFTDAKFLEEVPYDPDIYFGGYCEETTMSVRAWTSGYDFFSPYRQYIWHEYTRNGRPKHWDDHGTKSQTNLTSGERDIFGRKKTRQLFRQEDNGIDLTGFDLGSVRTLEEYEAFGGFDFKKCLIQDYTLRVKEPPNPTWEKDRDRIVEPIIVSWNSEHFRSQEDVKYKVITLGVLDKFGDNLVRIDFTPSVHPEIFNYSSNSFTINTVKSEAKKILMFGLKENDQWTTPYEKLL